ncbi:class I SAM-dependent methyltransferase [Crocosphaera sp. Alani8]|uniref:class I SAM-dependent methyltransferase n=1 Tax=Crocosphaera sp. Alani8 TaxID=3038952 RepID=UPI00313B2BD2
MKHYVIAGGVEGQSRLKILSRVLHSQTQHFFHRLGITSGMRCLDLGCGGGDVTFDLRTIVGQTGQVVGIDLDETIIQLARGECQQRGFKNVQFKVSNAETWEEASEYDLAYTRFLLTHLSHPQTVIENLKMSLKSGGLIAIEDLQFSGHFCYPKCRAFEQYIELYQQVVKRKGGDPEIGPKLPGMLQKAGFKQVNLNVIQPTFLEGEGKFLASITMEKIREAILEQSLSSPQEIKEIMDELNSFADNKQTIMSLPRIFQVWGAK